MISRRPIIAPCAAPHDILTASRLAGERRQEEEFARKLREMTGRRHVFFTGSGIAAFYIILKALKHSSKRNEVILPAYTAGSLAVAVDKAGLKPVLCDISPADFSMEQSGLAQVVSGRTLAVNAVHLFGIGQKDIGDLAAKDSDITVIEDCAQAMGSVIGGRPAGACGDVSFFSFNRGKNLPVFSGGAILMDSDDLARRIGQEVVRLPKAGGALKPFLASLAFCAAADPLVYGMAYPLISRFKETAPPEDIECRKMHGFCVSLGNMLMDNREKFFSARWSNGMTLIEGLKGAARISLPLIPENDRIVFNRLPVILEDPAGPERVSKRLLEAGIESSRMYRWPLHHMFKLGVDRDAFPGARHVAERLLTLPVHPACAKQDLQRMIEVIRKWA